MATRGYSSSYTGRDPLWKKFVAAFLILVILAALAVIYFQSHLVYDDNGVAYLDLPWVQEEESPAASVPTVEPEQPDEPLNITVTDSDKSPTALRGVQLAALPMTMELWTAEKAALPAGDELNAVALTLKDDSGHVYYDSLAARAVQDKIVRSAEDTGAAIADLTASYPYTVARLSCLADPIASRAELESMGLKNTGGYIFYDLYSGTWLDPSKEGTADYLATLARECAALGFDEILLTDLSYPTAGKLDKINYGSVEEVENGRSAALCGLVSAVRSALAGDYPAVKVSVELPAEVVATGADETAGQVLADFAKVVDRIYAPAPESEAPLLAEAVKRAGNEQVPFFVPEISAAAARGGLESYLSLPAE